MPGKGHAVVNVWFENGQPKCDEEWVHLYWRSGPDNIKWKFKDVPSEVEYIEIEFLDKLPKKYKQIPGFLHRGPFRGMGFAKSSSNKEFADTVTIGNTQEQGYFYYEVYFYREDGSLFAQLDPGGTVDPNEPPSPTPPVNP